MARGQTAQRSKKIKAAERAAPVAVIEIDATPERLAMGDHEVVEALRSSPQERMGKARKFRSAHLDRLHRSGNITYYQWYAGDWYRNAHARCGFTLSVVSSYGESTGGSVSPATFGYGLPRQEAQIRARKAFRDAQKQFSQGMVGFMDRLLIRDNLPRYGGRAAARSMIEIRVALDKLAHYLRAE
jgi:hypothetical protein